MALDVSDTAGPAPAHWYDGTPLIAHAGGGWRRSGCYEAYTNSYEALQQNYSLGMRVFEIDFTPTSDGELACTHDWVAYKHEVSSDEWRDSKNTLGTTFQGLMLNDLLNFMQQDPGIFVVCDTKVFVDAESIGIEGVYSMLVEQASQIDPALLDRFIPQAYNPETYETIMRAHDWKSVIYTIYGNYFPFEDIVAYAQEHPNIEVITVPYDDARVTPEGIELAHSLGKRVYMHTVNGYYLMAQGFARGADGFYTDLILPSDVIFYQRICAQEQAASGE